MKLLEISDLSASVDDQPILRGIDLNICAGEVHAIMGPNGSGKSTLANVIAGREDYRIDRGRIALEGEEITTLSPEERAHRGLFLAFQYPIEIPGVSNMEFLKAAVDSHARAAGEPESTTVDFVKMARSAAERLGLNPEFLKRGVNDGFSGGEKKRNEILQMLMLNPKVSILDETDSGLDIDALRIVANGISAFANTSNAVVLVTHYQRLLNHIEPDFVHVIANGSIVRSGDHSLALELEEKGYSWLENA
ncbi:MAG: Fe-S cluster assembly ATPase SufC [Pseudomonadota bacterium]|nr:Fe-S cluster assembly ATPase SufC [Pseudomonadota bacterium]